MPTALSTIQSWYGEMRNCIRRLVADGRRQVMWTANMQMSMTYYQIGVKVLNRQNAEGWGAKIVDWLAADLKKAFPEMHGFSPRNFKYMHLPFAPELSGSGTFDYREELALTKAGYSRSRWECPRYMRGAATSHNTNGRKSDYFQSAAREQEFVVDGTPAVMEWVKNLFNIK